MWRLQVAFVFPGQGAQHVGMGRSLYDAFPSARRALEEAAAGSDLDLLRLCFSGPEEALAETEVTQPALLAVSAAALAALADVGVFPAAAAGLSLGEYGALLAAGAADLGPLARLVRRRGRFMQEAVPLGAGAMAAVLGLDAAGVQALCRQAIASLREDGAEEPAGGWVLEPANWNGPGQVVVSGHTAAVQRAVALGRGAGARRVQLLPVSAPFHCPLMRPAQQRLAPELAAVAWREPAIPVVANVDARVVRTVAEVREALVQQVSSPVRWEECVRVLAGLGCDTFVEVGPGRTLSALVTRILPGARTLAVGDAEAVRACAEALRVA